MRRVYAVILLFPLISQFVGLVWLPAHCPEVAKTQCPMMGKRDTKCMKTMMMQHRMDMGLKGKPTGSGESKDTKKDGGCCIDCPLCYMVTFKPLIRFELTQTAGKTVYIVVSDNNLSDYYNQHWKPPCMASLS